MQHINKVCFAYPVIYKEGMSKDESCVPSPFISGYVHGNEVDLLVNVGLMITLATKTHINVVVNRKGCTDEPEKSNGNGKFENLKSNILHDGQAIILTSLYLEKVKFEESGEYEIKVSLYGPGTDGEQITTPLDIYYSFFYFLAGEKSNNA